MIATLNRGLRTYCLRPVINHSLFPSQSVGQSVDSPGATSAICRAGDLDRPIFLEWAIGLRQPVRYNRKVWEWCFIPAVLSSRGLLSNGKRGLGFAVGQEPLATLFASRGCWITATDLAKHDARSRAWRDTGQHAENLSSLNSAGRCSDEIFYDRILFRPVDMNAIPADLLQGQYDFTWSTCSFEHCGTLQLGLEFVRRQMACLRPGGTAVHTTELNLSSNASTIESGPTVIYRRRDIERLIAALTADGHTVARLDTRLGDHPLDRHVDRRPYDFSRHMRLALYGYVVTSVGLVITKGR
jgi:hypothetical protein